MAGEELVTVYETGVREQAAIVRLALADAGIRFITTNEDVSVLYPMADSFARLGFQVLARDEEAARKVIGGLWFEQGGEE